MSFEILKQCIINNRIQAEKDKREEDRPTSECPFCAWPLHISDSGVACEMCGRIWN